MKSFMSKKRLFSVPEACVMNEAAANLAAIGRLAAEYGCPTKWTARHIRGLVMDVEENPTNLVKGNYRHGGTQKEAEID